MTQKAELTTADHQALRFAARIEELEAEVATLRGALEWLLDDVMDDELEVVGKDAEGVAKVREALREYHRCAVRS